MEYPQFPHRHIPSAARGQFYIWLDFFLRGNQLYDKKTGLSTCSLCGTNIIIPREYGKTMPIWVYSYGLGSCTVFMLILQYLRDNTSWSNTIIIIIGLLCGTTLFILSKRINKARLLSCYKWEQITSDDYGLFVKEIAVDNKRVRYAEASGIFAAIIIIRLFI